MNTEINQTCTFTGHRHFKRHNANEPNVQAVANAADSMENGDGKNVEGCTR